MASGPITSWQIDGEIMEIVTDVTDFVFLDSRITVDDDYRHGIETHLFLMVGAGGTITKPDSIIKSKDVTLLTTVHIVKTMVLPVVMCGYESWTIKKAECQRTDVFELWCWRRLLGVPWTARRANQSVSRVWLFETLWIEESQASRSFSIS